MPKFSRKTTNNNNPAIYKKQCKYIGTISLSDLSQKEWLRFVNERMTETHDKRSGVKVIASVTDDGIKIFNDSESAVKMAHVITKVAFSTCLPNRKIFSYVAKSKRPDDSVLVQAHMFRTKKTHHSQQLNNSLTKAFNLALARSTRKRQAKNKAFDSIQSTQAKPANGKRWAKIDAADGRHRHADQKQVASPKSSNSRENSNGTSPKITNESFDYEPAKPTSPKRTNERLESKPIAQSEKDPDPLQVVTVPKRFSDVDSFSPTKSYENVDINQRPMSISEVSITDFEWYKPDFSRETAEEYLKGKMIGAFIVRDSNSHLHAYVLSAKVPTSFKANGMGNFLIEQIESGHFRVKGFSSAYPSLTELVANYGSDQQELPCQLRMAEENPLFRETAGSSEDSDDDYDDPDYDLFDRSTELIQELAKCV